MWRSRMRRRGSLIWEKKQDTMISETSKDSEAWFFWFRKSPCCSTQVWGMEEDFWLSAQPLKGCIIMILTVLNTSQIWRHPPLWRQTWGLGWFSKQAEQILILSGPQKGFPDGIVNCCCFPSTLKRFKIRSPKGLSTSLGSCSKRW